MALNLWYSCLLGVMIVNTGLYVDGSYCTPGVAKAGDPRLPVINATAFTIEYQINIIDRKYTMWAREDYDYISNKVKMTMNKNGLQEGIIMDYNDNIIVSYQYEDLVKSRYSCIIEQLNNSNTDNFHVFGGVQSGSRSMPHLYSSKDVFSFSSSLGETYLGNTTIDGVTVDHWRSCVYWADDRDNFTLDYYFTTPDWTPVDAISQKQIPIRAIVTGVKDVGNGSTYTFTHLYEYLNFRVFPRLPEENFALPENMKCEDTKGLRKKPLPDMPVRMAYTVEIVEGDARMVDVFYDENMRLVRTLEKNVISIDDFNTGVHYSIDKGTQICSSRPILVDIDSDAVNSSRSVRMIARQELFYLDGDFTYTGQVDVRGIRCDGWARNKMIQGVNSSIEVYFAVTSVKYRSSFSGRVLVSIVIKNKKNTVTYNFFDQESKPDISGNPFDITACRNASDMIDFRMVFSYKPNEAFEQRIQDALIHDSLSSFTVHLTGVSPVQVHWADLEVDHVNKQLHWLGSILAPDPLIMGSKVENYASQISPEEALSVLQQLISSGTFIVTIPLPSETTAGSIIVNLTALEIRKVENEVDFADDADISLGHFIISNDLQVVTYTPEETLNAVSSAAACADKCFKKSIYQCLSFSYCYKVMWCQLSSQKWDNATMMESKGCNFYRRDYTSDFTKFPGKTLKPKDSELIHEVSSVQTCADLCLKETMFTCKSFDYCDSSQDCYLGRNHFYGTPESDVQISATCEHYSINYVADYVKSSTTELVVSNSSQMLVLTEDGSSPIHCAYTCSNDVDGCVRFSFCSSTKQCQLVNSSYVSTVKTQASSVCDVYTLKSAQVDPGRGRSSGYQSASPDTTYSPGSVAGVAVGTLVIGVIVTVIVIFLLRRFKVWNPL